MEETEMRAKVITRDLITKFDLKVPLVSNNYPYCMKSYKTLDYSKKIFSYEAVSSEHT